MRVTVYKGEWSDGWDVRIVEGNELIATCSSKDVVSISAAGT